jgi:TetR/AcrR family transcriptional repressor of nem operon
MMMGRGRPRTFDREETVAKAKNLFWESGYHASGLNDLLKEMSIARQSLYSTFGDKRGLFIEALKNYGQLEYAEMAQYLNREGSPLANYKALLNEARRRTREPDFKGCLIANTISELGRKDPEIGKFFMEQIEIIEAGFRDCLQRAKDAGEISLALPTRQIARLSVVCFLGITSLAQLPNSEDFTDDVFNLLMSLLE